MAVYEPMTFATDLLLAGATGWFGLRLLRHGRLERIYSVRLWGAGFMASGTGALSGGIYHALGPEAPLLLKYWLWKVTVYAIGGAGLLLVLGAVRSVLSGRSRRWLTVAVEIKFGIYALWMTTHDAFRYVIYDYAPSLVLILILYLVSYAGHRNPAAQWIAGGIVLSFVAAVIQLLRIAPHPHFNHNDLYHVVQLGAFWLLWQGGMLMQDRNGCS